MWTLTIFLSIIS